MALIKCEDCGKDVSTLAATCPNCGRPVEVQQSQLLVEKSIVCSDGNCKGVLDEDGECGMCVKPADWPDDSDETLPELLITPYKQSSRKGLLVVIILITCGLGAVFVFSTLYVPNRPKPSAVVPPVGLIAQIATRDKIYKEKCVNKIEGMKAEFSKLMSEKKYSDASLVAIGSCAESLQDKSLDAWLDDARVQYYSQPIKDPKTPIIEKINLVEMFEQFYPEKAQPYVRLLPEMRKKLAAQEAAQKKRKGVRIGMTPEDVRASSWGKPESINRTTATYGTHEQWVYGGRGYLYFEDGILTAIQN